MSRVNHKAGRFAARHSKRVGENLQRLQRFFAPLASLVFDDRCAEECAQIRADLSAQGKIIGPNDMLIAAIARANNAILVTHNFDEFSRIVGMAIEDWQN